MKKSLNESIIEISNSPSISPKILKTSSNNVINFSDTNSDTFLIKNIKDIFYTSKLYHKYLLTIKIKITNSNISDTIDIKNFDEFYDNSNIIYNEIKKEWFWLSNGDKMIQFINNSDSMDNHKQNYYNNFHMLEVIAKLYGFETWALNKKNKLLEKTKLNESKSSLKLDSLLKPNI
jgi:hypothetical protein